MLCFVGALRFCREDGVVVGKSGSRVCANTPPLYPTSKAGGDPTLHDREAVVEDGAPGFGPDEGWVKSKSRFPSGMTTRKARATAGSLRSGREDGVGQVEKQIPFGNDNQKGQISGA